MTAPAKENVRTIFAAVADLWLQRRPSAGLLPSRSAFDMLDFKPWLGWVSIYDIEYGDPIRFKIRLAGTQVTIIEQADNTGRYLDEVFPPADYPGVFAPYFEALESREPVYLQRTVPTRSGVSKTLSKLVLPVAQDGLRPDKFINILHYSAVIELDAAKQRLVI